MVEYFNAAGSNLAELPLGPTLMHNAGRWALRLLEVAAVICIPLFLIVFSVRVVVNAPLLYEYGFEVYGIPQRTGIAMDQLLDAAAQTRDYFNAENEDPLHVVVQRGGAPFELYNQREITHMADVKELLGRVRFVENAIFTMLLLLLGIGLWVRRLFFVPRVLSTVFQGSGLTVGLVVLAGLGTLVGFEQLFLQFHLLSFSNDFWMLDPRRDFLIMMYPFEFFRDATVIIAVLVLMLALGLAVVSMLGLSKLPAMYRTK